MILERMRYGFLSRMRRPEGIAPKVTQDIRVRLGMRQGVLFDLSLCATLVLMILIFKFAPEYKPDGGSLIAKQEMVKFEDIDLTRQENRPPPPPRPHIPIEAPSDEALDDVELHDTELNIAQEVAPPPPRMVDDEEQYFVAVEEMPQVIGGVEAIQRNVSYPELAVRAGVQGRVFVMAYVNTDGRVAKAEVVKGIGAGCDEAAMEAVLKARFIPGKQRGIAVRVRVVVPVVFRLRNL
jgi:protein TonB